MIVLDTCAIIWDALETSELSPLATKAIKDAKNELIICDISFWEISMLIKRKRLEVEDTASSFIKILLQSRSFHIQEITPEIAELSVNLESEINNDPADRLIAATSIGPQVESIPAPRIARQYTRLPTGHQVNPPGAQQGLGLQGIRHVLALVVNQSRRPLQPIDPLYAREGMTLPK